VIQEFGEKCTLSRGVESLDAAVRRAEEGSGTRKGMDLPVRPVSALPETEPLQSTDEAVLPTNVPMNESVKHATEFPGLG
jgi:hypothetical protein